MLNLASNPLQNPRFSQTVRRTDGRTLVVGDPRATRAMVALMDMHAVLGGAAAHFGGPAALAELMSALHALVLEQAHDKGVQYHDLFHLVNDAGHCENGLYALKANYGWAGVTFEELKSFRALGSRLTGHGEAHLFPEGVLLSNGPLGSSLGQAQGLAMADKLRNSSRTTIVTISDGACMEGEAREALASIPGLAAKGKLAPFVLIISDNNTKLSGRIDKDCFSMSPTFASLRQLGWNVMDLATGNDLQSCVQTIETAIAQAAQNPMQPIVIHARTVKGFGVKKTVESASGGHGFPLKAPSELRGFLTEIYGSDAVPEFFTQWTESLITAAEEAKPSKSPVPLSWGPTEKIQVGIAQAMIEARQKGWPVVSVTSDLPGSTGVAEFHKKYPEFVFDVGVAESNMVSVGAGFSKLGFIPVVDTFAQFGVTKGALPLIMANLSRAPVIAVFSHTGFQDAADGASHQALSYFSMVNSIPFTQVYALSCRDEAQALMLQAFDDFRRHRELGQTPEQIIFFLGRENFPTYYKKEASYVLGQSQVYSAPEGTRPTLAILAFGSMLREAILAQHIVAERGIGVEVINASIVNRPDLATTLPVLSRCGNRLITLEDHQVIGGAGALWVQSLAQALAKNNDKFASLHCLGVQGEFGQSAYTADDLYRKHHIDGASVARIILENLSAK